MAIKIEFEKKEKAIELPDGTILDIPERTKINDDKVQSVISNRESKKEYDFLIAILEALFGKEGVKIIVPDAKNANLDYLTAVYTASINAFYEDKLEADRGEMQKHMEQLEPLTDKLSAINPLINKIR